ncbi:hypothetical protein PtA15_14A9 [Puccinia triticina]|uniref:Uncharacterized protein n=1 Tax=Puccinia triticina TaxID=208348 RepID=A0ABY7D0N9_9BASI|nr:uncharacterized protein PtA15_14A9 [Puccinia triticina]WAQ91129.1 hypothetical protein PtA15_14A9 [Puccinia triticina]
MGLPKFIASDLVYHEQPTDPQTRSTALTALATDNSHPPLRSSIPLTVSSSNPSDPTTSHPLQWTQLF